MPDDLASASVRIEPDLDYFRDLLEVRLQEALAGVTGSAQVRVGADTSDAQTRLDQIEARLGALAREKATVMVQADTDAARARLQEIDAEMGKLRNARAVASADVNTADGQAKLTELNARLDAFGKKRVTGEADMDTRSAVSNMRQADDAATRLSTHLGGVGMSSQHAGNLMGTLTKVAVGMSAAIAPIIPVAEGLALGLGGIGIAGIVGMEAFKAAANQVLPWFSAQAQTIEHAWGQAMGPIVSPVFQNALQMLPRLLGLLTPIIQGASLGLQSLEGTINQIISNPATGAFFRVLGQEIAIVFGQLGPIFANIFTLIERFMVAAGPLINVVLGILVRVTGALANSNITGFITNITASLIYLGPIVGNFLMSILRLGESLFRALQPIGTAFFQALSAIIPALIPVVNALGQMFNVLGPVIGRVAGALGTLLAQAVRSLAPLLSALIPVISSLVRAMGGELVTLLQGLTPLIVGVAHALIPFIQGLASSLGPVAQGFSALVVAATPLTYAFIPFARSIQTMGPQLRALGVAVGQLAPPLVQIATEVLKFGAMLMEALTPAAMSVARVLLQILVPVIHGLATVLKNVPQPIVDIVGSFILWERYGSRIPEMLGKISSGAIGMARNMLASIPGLGFLATGETSLTDATLGLTAAIERLQVQMAEAAPETEALGAADLAAAGSTGILSTALGAMGAVLDVALGPVGAVILAIAALGLAAYELYTHWDTVWSGIKMVFDDVVQFLRGWLGTGLIILLTGPIAPLLLLALHWQQAWGFMRDVVHEVWDGILTGVQTGVNLVIDMIDHLISAFDAVTSWVPGIPHINTIGHIQIAARAEGGPIDPNSPYLVGERGPEVVVPRTPGTVLPNTVFGGQGQASGYGATAGNPFANLGYGGLTATTGPSNVQLTNPMAPGYGTAIGTRIMTELANGLRTSVPIVEDAIRQLGIVLPTAWAQVTPQWLRTTEQTMSQLVTQITNTQPRAREAMQVLANTSNQGLMNLQRLAGETGSQSMSQFLQTILAGGPGARQNAILLAQSGNQGLQTLHQLAQNSGSQAMQALVGQITAAHTPAHTAATGVAQTANQALAAQIPQTTTIGRQGAQAYTGNLASVGVPAASSAGTGIGTAANTALSNVNPGLGSTGGAGAGAWTGGLNNPGTQAQAAGAANALGSAGAAALGSPNMLGAYNADGLGLGQSFLGGMLQATGVGGGQIMRAVGDLASKATSVLAAALAPWQSLPVVGYGSDIISTAPGHVGDYVGSAGQTQNLYQGHAEGGDVAGGVPIVVGEKGPELFVPPTSGSIIPNAATSSTIEGARTWSGTLARAVNDGWNTQLAGTRAFGTNFQSLLTNAWNLALTATRSYGSQTTNTHQQTWQQVLAQSTGSWSSLFGGLTANTNLSLNQTRSYGVQTAQTHTDAWNLTRAVSQSVWDSMLGLLVSHNATSLANTINYGQQTQSFHHTTWANTAADSQNIWAQMTANLANTNANQLVDTTNQVNQTRANVIAAHTDMAAQVPTIVGGMWMNVGNNYRTGIDGTIGSLNTFLSNINTVGAQVGWAVQLHVNTLAAGGEIGGLYNRATAIVGEGDTHHPEYVIPTDPVHRRRAMELTGDLHRQLGLPMMADGGVLNSAVSLAQSFMGTPYVYAGSTPGQALDCSGLIWVIAQALGIPNYPRTSESQFTYGPPAATPGAGMPIFFNIPGRDANPDHVGLYLGGGSMIDAPYTGTVVRVDSVAAGGSVMPAGSTIAGFTNPFGAAATNIPPWTPLPAPGTLSGLPPAVANALAPHVTDELGQKQAAWVAMLASQAQSSGGFVAAPGNVPGNLQAFFTTLGGMLGIPASAMPQALQDFAAWQSVEGGWLGNPDQFNPFNTTQGAPGAVTTNSAGVKSYPSIQAGLSATAETLMMGSYAAILSDLRSGAPLSKFEADVNASPWGTHFAKGGILPIAEYDSGGWLPTGASIAINRTGAGERVLGPGDGTTIHYNPQYTISLPVAQNGTPEEYAAALDQRLEQHDSALYDALRAHGLVN